MKGGDEKSTNGQENETVQYETLYYPSPPQYQQHHHHQKLDLVDGLSQHSILSRVTLSDESSLKAESTNKNSRPLSKMRSLSVVNLGILAFVFHRNDGRVSFVSAYLTHRQNAHVHPKATRYPVLTKARNHHTRDECPSTTAPNVAKQTSSSRRRSVLSSLLSLASCPAIILQPKQSNAFIQQPPVPRGMNPIDAADATAVDVGNGFDLRVSESMLPKTDVVYPASMEGIWRCQRVVTSCEGDAYMAETAWRLLAGGGGAGSNNNKKSAFHDPEVFLTKYVKPMNKDDGEIASTIVVLDRGFEYASRTEASDTDGSRSGSVGTVTWSIDQPNILQYDKKDNESSIKITVVQRSVEFPTDKGFGYNELYRIDERGGSSGVSPLVGGGRFTRAAQVKRRYRRAFDDATGARVVEGLEIMKTFRVLDDIAGTGLPTSTTKSQIRLTRL